MPHINRIRVNNVKYNFGTQFYDDFIMRFSGKNTIYDLANGGGKSVLMLLLFQNLIPNCTLDDKQPIEKLFRTGEGSKTIHSLIEWNLSDIHIKDNYKYMLTGFCARKAGESGEDNRDNASIEYFNYVIFYRNYNDNDLKNLPLQNGKERVTYNGLKNYLRELGKKDLGLSVHIFEKKSEYQRFISDYGLYESEWEIIRGINKTEGHVRTYFETNYKTTRKVVEDLLIEEIIQRSFSNRYGTAEEETMAQTLLEIKDKLIELSDKKSQISGYDMQQDILEGFVNRTASLKNIYSEKESLEGEICRAYNAIMQKEAGYNENHAHLLEQIREAEEGMNEASRLLETAKIMKEKNAVLDINRQLERATAEAEEIQKNLEAREGELRFSESGNDYLDYLSDKAEADSVREYIVARRKDSSAISQEAEELAGAVYELNKVKLSEMNQQLISEQNLAEREAEANRELSHMERELGNKVAVLTYRLGDAEHEYDIQNACVMKEMSKFGLLTTAGIPVELQRMEKEIQKLKNDISELDAEYDGIVKHMEADKILLENKRYEFNELQNREAELQDRLVQCQEDARRYEKIQSVYKDKKIEQMLMDVIRQIAEQEQLLVKLQKKLDAYKRNLSVVPSDELIEVCEYIERYHGEICESGAMYLSRLNKGDRESLIEHIPILPYSVVVLKDFDKLVPDTRLMELCHHKGCVCIIDVDAITGCKDIINGESVIVSMDKKNIFTDDNAIPAGMANCQEEINNTQENIYRLYEYEKVIREDYVFMAGYNVNTSEQELNSCQEKIREISGDIEELEISVRTNDTRKKNIKDIITTKSDEAEALMSDIEKLTELTKQYTSCGVLEHDISKLREQMESDSKEHRNVQARLEAALNQARQRQNKISGIMSDKEIIQKNWDEKFSIYYRQGICGKTDEAYDDIVNKLQGVIAAINDENSDLADKERLLKNYENSMNKALSNIKYRDIDIEKLREAYEENELFRLDEAELRQIKSECEELRNKLNNTYRELDDIRSKRDKSEGGTGHGIRQIEEKYGFYSEDGIEANNLQEFIDAKIVAREELRNRREELANQLDTMEKFAGKQVIAKENLERIIQSGNINPDMYPGYYTGEEDLYSLTRKMSGEYDRFIRTLYEKKDEFEHNKRMLMDTLRSLNAEPLAEEIDRSVVLPESVEETNALITRLKDTVVCIELEKSRIGKGIEDMEKIKDNFENQCIQTGIRIKTELERLPKLSKITLDGENISVIDLRIPYVPEETYKSRMSEYINETVNGADELNTQEEKIKYIRTRLTWKRLFSVIVSDMNGIRLNLYKRERIVENSRFLPYEEAVGSTGQSQGIYIQFLISVINYISSVNSRGADASGLKKVIFIDNPFGAAKDVYIWEPIFGLLKTNNVQLVVPARGATPAITGRFDVNYVLGQRLINGKQQTVVVDYYSNVDNSSMEYTTLSYEQTSMF